MPEVFRKRWNSVKLTLLLGFLLPTRPSPKALGTGLKSEKEFDNYVMNIFRNRYVQLTVDIPVVMCSDT